MIKKFRKNSKEKIKYVDIYYTIEDLQPLIKKGFSDVEIGKKLNLHKTTIGKLKKGIIKKSRPIGTKLRNPPRITKKVTPKIKKEMIRLANNEYSQVQIAKMTGFAASTVAYHAFGQKENRLKSSKKWRTNNPDYPHQYYHRESIHNRILKKAKIKLEKEKRKEP